MTAFIGITIWQFIIIALIFSPAIVIGIFWTLQAFLAPKESSMRLRLFKLLMLVDAIALIMLLIYLYWGFYLGNAMIDYNLFEGKSLI